MTYFHLRFEVFAYLLGATNLALIRRLRYRCTQVTHNLVSFISSVGDVALKFALKEVGVKTLSFYL